NNSLKKGGAPVASFSVDVVERSLMPATLTTADQAITRPETFRLPKPGSGDPFFGLSRSFYYEGEKRRYWKLIRIRNEDKERGVTLVPYKAVEAFVRSQAEDG